MLYLFLHDYKAEVWDFRKGRFLNFVIKILVRADETKKQKNWS